MQVAVLDEIQMLSDPCRGWGWTRAFLGLPARQLHVCGSANVLPLIETMAQQCGDAVKVCSNVCPNYDGVDC